MAFEITPKKIQSLDKLVSFRYRTNQDRTGSTAASFSHLPVELRDKVRWILAGIYDEWSVTTARAENAWSPDAQDELWNKADSLWATYEATKTAWGIG